MGKNARIADKNREDHDSKRHRGKTYIRPIVSARTAQASNRLQFTIGGYLHFKQGIAIQTQIRLSVSNHYAKNADNFYLTSNRFAFEMLTSFLLRKWYG
jgi:hypothetical protein